MRFMPAPVPAGMRRPTMTFSFRPTSVILLALDRSLGQHAGGFLERSRRDEAERVCSDALVMPRRIGLPTAAGSPPVTRGLGVDLEHFFTVDFFGNRKQRRVTGMGDFNLLQHLTNDRFDVLVVDASRPASDTLPGFPRRDIRPAARCPSLPECHADQASRKRWLSPRFTKSPS